MDYLKEKQRQPLIKLILSGALYMLAGNLFCTIVTISIAPFIKEPFIKVLVFIFCLAIFYSLVFTVAYKDGDREQHYVRLHKVEPPSQYKWLKIGVIMLGIMLIPSVVLLVDKLAGFYYDMLMIYRFLCGTVYPLSLILIPESSVDTMEVFVPFVFMACYALTPVVTHLGYYFGYTGKLDTQNIMYQ